MGNFTEFYNQIDAWLSSVKTSCRGCAACCSCYTIPIAIAEIHHIAAHADIKSALARMRRYTNPIQLSTLCPFLENNRCTIYDIRPLTCRAYRSVESSCLKLEAFCKQYQSNYDTPLVSVPLAMDLMWMTSLIPDELSMLMMKTLSPHGQSLLPNAVLVGAGFKNLIADDSSNLDDVWDELLTIPYDKQVERN